MPPRLRLPAVLLPVTLALSGCWGDDDDRKDRNETKIDPCQVLSATPAASGVVTPVNPQVTVIYTAPTGTQCHDVRLTSADGTALATDPVTRYEWADPQGGVVGTVIIEPRAPLVSGQAYQVLMNQQKVATFQAGSARRGAMVAATPQPAKFGELQGDLIPPAQINDVLDETVEALIKQPLVDVIVEELVASDLPFIAKPGATYAARVRKLTYTSTAANGAPVTLSGLLVMPERPDGSAMSYQGVPIVLSQRGTQSADEPAPSSAAPGVLIPGLLAAGKGHIFFAPDLIGIGDSAGQPQAYLVTKDTAAQTQDMLLAVREYVSRQFGGAVPGPDLRVVGTSQGAHSALAALPQLSRLANIKYVAGAEGPYDVQRTADATLRALAGSARDAYSLYENLAFVPSYLKGVLEGLRAYQGFQYEPDQIFDKSGQLQPGFLINYKAGQFRTLTQHLGANSLASNAQNYNLPQANIRLYHFHADTLVPAQNSIDMLALLNSGGSTVASAQRGDCRESSRLSRTVMTLSQSPVKSHLVCMPFLLDDLVAELNGS